MLTKISDGLSIDLREIVMIAVNPQGAVVTFRGGAVSTIYQSDVESVRDAAEALKEPVAIMGEVLRAEKHDKINNDVGVEHKRRGRPAKVVTEGITGIAGTC